jgi:DNA-directed RNA polymerase specialized sigma24 family protein
VRAVLHTFLHRRISVSGTNGNWRRCPEDERIVFELAAIEGFSSEGAGQILNMPADDVERIKTKVRQTVLQQLQSPTRKKAS